MTAQSNPAPAGRRWTAYASYVVVLGMLVCIAITILQFLHWLIPAWDARGMVFICILAAIEAMLSNWLIQNLPTAQRQTIQYRITEWIILLVVLKIFAELVIGPAAFWNNLLLWPQKFPENIFNARFFLALLPVGVVWEISNLYNKELSLLGTFETYLLDERLKTASVHNLVIRRFLTVGMFVVVLAGIPSQVVLSISLHPASNGGVPAAVMYFVLGIILLSLTRYTSLATNWLQAKVSIPAQVPRRWFAYSAVIIGILVLLVIWLPTNYGMGFLDTITAILGILYQVIVAMYAMYVFILLLINAITRLIYSLFGTVPPDQILPAPPTSNPPPAGSSPINWELIKSIFLWVGLIVLAVVALRQYILYNKDLAEDLKRFKPLKWFMILWKRITTSIKKANKSVGMFVQNRLQRLRNAGKTPTDMSEWEYINPRRLNSRQKIIFYYLALLRRADEAGLPRKAGQTPYEYASSLTSSLAEGKDGVQGLTESFVEARYSSHEIPAKEARQAGSLWETIQRLLRTERKSSREGKDSKDD